MTADARRFTDGRTLWSMLEERARSCPRARLHFYGTQTPALSLTELLSLSRRCAAGLAALGVGQGDRVLLASGTAPPFVGAFFGAQLLGAVPVPIAPPRRTRGTCPNTERALSIAAVTRPRVSVFATRAAGVAAAAERAGAFGRSIDGEELLAFPHAYEAPAPVDAGAIAFLQFTSGSTGDPKGVVLTQASVLSNLQAIGEALEFVSGDVGCSWLPLHHDMGLIGHLLCPMAWGVSAVLMQPELFMRRPIEWLRAITRHRGTIGAGSSYAYALCARRAREKDLAGLDLSSWRAALVGGESVGRAALEEFGRRFAPVGFRSRAWLPAYGLAEATLAVTLSKLGAGVHVDRVDRSTFQREGIARPVIGVGAESLGMVSVGSAVARTEVRIVDADGHLLPERVEGDIQVRGHSVMLGYYEPCGVQRRALAGWLQTGDRGYLAGGELFISGRARELVIVRGRAIYPHDVEQAVATVGPLAKARCVAFGARSEGQGTEDLIVACEIRQLDADEQASLRHLVRRAVVSSVGVAPRAIVLTRPGAIPRTTSGKPQRASLRARFEQDEGALHACSSTP